MIPIVKMKRSVFIGLLLIFILVGCGKSTVEKDGEPYVIGHGGSGDMEAFGTLPTNCKKSLLDGVVKHRADGVELDVQMSSDTVLFVFHDQLLDKKTKCNGLIIEMDSMALSACEYRTLIGKHNVIDLEEIMRNFSTSFQTSYYF